jgi:hypothetical protein
MAFDISDPLASINLGGIQAQAYDIAYYIIWGVIILGIVLFLYFKYQDKKIFIYPTRIFRRRSNGLIKEFNTFGGYLLKNGVTEFTIKMGRFKKKGLQRLPNSELMDEEDRVYFYQISPEAPLIQCRREIKIEKVEIFDDKYIEPSEVERQKILDRYLLELKSIEENKELKDDELKLVALQRLEQEIQEEKYKKIDVTSAYYTPVPTDQKLQAYHDIRTLSNTLGVDVNKQFAYFVIGVIAIVIIGVVIFYIAINKGDIPILTK